MSQYSKSLSEIQSLSSSPEPSSPQNLLYPDKETHVVTPERETTIIGKLGSYENPVEFNLYMKRVTIMPPTPQRNAAKKRRI